MSLKLKRNIPLILSLLAVVLVLVLAFGNLRVGATNVRLGTWTELRVSTSLTSAPPAAAEISVTSDALSAANTSAQAAPDVEINN